MTHSFITHLSRGICLLALCFGQVLLATPSMAAAAAAAAAPTAKGTQETIKSGVDYAGRGLGDIQTGIKPGTDAAGELLGAAGSFGVDTGSLGGQLGSLTGGLTTGKGILDSAGKLSGTDFGSLLPSTGNGKFDFSKMKDAFGSSLSGIGTTLGNKWDSVKGISVSGIWGDTTNFMKDLTPDIKGLTAEKLMEFDFSGLTTLFPAGGIPSILVDLEPLNIYTVVATEGTFMSKEAQLAYEQAYTPTIGPIGVMDGRMGLCQVNGHDYTGTIQAFLGGPGKTNEGDIPWLHLDSSCWATIGIGTVLTQRGKSYEAMKTYFMSMDYQPKSVQLDEFNKIYELQKACLVKCASTGLDHKGRCNNNLEVVYKSQFTGRLTAQATQDVAIAELCEDHVKKYIVRYMAKSEGNYANLPLEHQIVLLDMSYQRPKSVTNDSGSAQMRSALISKNCSAAVSAFNQGYLASKFTNRAAWRRSALMAPCGGGS